MARDVSDVTHRKRGLRFGKSKLVEILHRKKTVDFHKLAEALCRVRTWFLADGKVRCISILKSKKLLTQR